MNGFYLPDTVYKWHIFFDLPTVASILADWETGTALPIAPELNTLWRSRRCWVLLTLNPYQSFITV